MAARARRSLPSAENLWRAYQAAVLVERCNAAILEYENAGISGTVHDVENKRIREDALRDVREALDGGKGAA
jgi:hypothetical protein